MATSNFTVVVPQSITESNLVSSNVPETDYPVWSSATTYAVADRVIMTTGIHKIYESITAGNHNNPPNLHPEHWVEVGPTNRYKMFDASTGTVTSNPVNITTSFTLDRINTVGLIDINATKVDIIASESETTKYSFKNTLNGFISYPGVFGEVYTSASHMVLQATENTPSYYIGIITKTTSFLGSENKVVSIRLSKPTNGAPWVGVLLYGNNLHGENGLYVCGAPEPDWDESGWGIATWDMENNSSNPADWLNNTVNYLRFDLIYGSVNPSSTNIDWIAHGNIFYAKTFNVPDRAIINDWYDYFYAENFRATSLIISDIPALTNSHFNVEIYSSSGNAECGSLLAGSAARLGYTQYGAGIGNTDYSVKTTDEFGKTTLVERPFSKRNDVKLYVNSTDLDSVISKLNRVRATPCLWIGANGIYESLTTYGFYRDYKAEITYPTYSVLSLEIEGLT